MVLYYQMCLLHHPGAVVYMPNFSSLLDLWDYSLFFHIYMYGTSFPLIKIYWWKQSADCLITSITWLLCAVAIVGVSEARQQKDIRFASSYRPQVLYMKTQSVHCANLQRQRLYTFHLGIKQYTMFSIEGAWGESCNYFSFYCKYQSAQ